MLHARRPPYVRIAVALTCARLRSSQPDLLPEEGSPRAGIGNSSVGGLDKRELEIMSVDRYLVHENACICTEPDLDRAVSLVRQPLLSFLSSSAVPSRSLPIRCMTRSRYTMRKSPPLGSGPTSSTSILPPSGKANRKCTAAFRPIMPSRAPRNSPM